MAKLRNAALLVGAILAPLMAAGCFPWVHPAQLVSMGLYTPVPVPPWVSERMEEKYCYKNDHRTPIMPPIREGYPPPLCEDPPDEAMILRAMPHVVRGTPYVYEEFRDNIQIVTERIVDKIDPCRFYPLVGLAQLHHCHWKCTIYYVETIESGWPFPYQCKRPRIEVIYIDKDHLHLCTGTNPQVQENFTRQTTGY